MSDSKVRLERIKNDIKKVDSYFIEGLDELALELLSKLNSQFDFDWLTEQAGKLEEIRNIFYDKSINTVEGDQKIIEVLEDKQVPKEALN